jgi:hypothetical protein
LHFALAWLVELLWKMPSPPSEDPLAVFDIFLEFLPAFDFEESFRFAGSFNFNEFGESDGMIAAGKPMSYDGAWDDASCSFYIKSSVQLCRQCHCCKQRNPNRLYRKESIL